MIMHTMAIYKVMSRRGAVFGFMIFGAILAFEIFNYSTTQFALQDVLGDLAFLGIQWATILALAFCGIDFAGIARIFTPEQGREEPAEVWYLFGAWLLAAGMNATLTWWGVSVAMENRQIAGTAIIESSTMMTAVPIFVAVMVWVIRILIGYACFHDGHCTVFICGKIRIRIQSEGRWSIISGWEDLAERVVNFIRDPQKSEVIIVTIPEALGVKQTERIIKDFDEYQLKVHYLMVNYVIQKADCEFHRKRSEMQQSYIKILRDQYSRRIQLIQTPLFPLAVKGVEKIKMISDILFSPNPFEGG